MRTQIIPQTQSAATREVNWLKQTSWLGKTIPDKMEHERSTVYSAPRRVPVLGQCQTSTLVLVMFNTFSFDGSNFTHRTRIFQTGTITIIMIIPFNWLFQFFSAELCEQLNCRMRLFHFSAGHYLIWSDQLMAGIRLLANILPTLISQLLAGTCNKVVIENTADYYHFMKAFMHGSDWVKLRGATLSVLLSVLT